MKRRIGRRAPGAGGRKGTRFPANWLLVVLLAVSCSGSPGSVIPNGSNSNPSVPYRDDELLLEIRKLGVNTDLVVQAGRGLRARDIDPLMKMSNPVRIKPDFRVLDLCSTYQLTLLDVRGSPVGGVKWFLDANHILKNEVAELDRDTGVLKTKNRSSVLYITGFVRGVGAWANLFMNGTPCPGTGGSPSPKPPTPAPTPTPSGGVVVDHDFGSF